MFMPRIKNKSLLIISIVSVILLSAPLGTAFADTCGAAGDTQVKTAIDLGCHGIGNPVMDMLFAIIRFLTAGVGLVLVGSLVYAGIQYSASQGDPNNTAAAVKRIKSILGALLLFIFAYAILNYVVPGMVIK